MNIFYISENPYTCAKWYGDKHVSKQILETAQMLSTAHHVLSPSKDNSKLYKPTHINHPCTVWVRSGSANYEWTWLLLQALCEEFTFRRSKEHATETKLLWSLRIWPDIEYTSEMTDPALAMPDEFKTDDPIEAYQNYYKHKFHQGIVTYDWHEQRKAPDWLFSTRR